MSSGIENEILYSVKKEITDNYYKRMAFNERDFLDFCRSYQIKNYLNLRYNK